MDPLTALIHDEEAKLEVAMAKVRDIQERLATLRKMQTRDDLDNALERRAGNSRMSVQAPAPEPSQTPALRKQWPMPPAPAPIEEPAKDSDAAASGERVRNKRGSVRRLVLEALTSGPVVEMGQITRYVQARATSPVADGALRTVLMTLRREDGLVFSHKPGVFSLSEKGKELMFPAQSETAPVGAGAVSVSSVPASQAAQSEGSSDGSET